MDPKTKKHALHKARVMEAHLAYPDELLDDKKLEDLYEKLVINPNEYYNSGLNITTYNNENEVDKYRKPVNISDWVTRPPPCIVDAFYDPRANSIEFPASILQGDFYNKDRPQYMNYGGIGTGIGHEITHGFDNIGRMFDYKGEVVDWWKEETDENFRERADCIMQQYNNYTVEELGLSVDGFLTIGENIADIGATKLGYYGYKEWIKRNGPERKLPGIDFTPSQLFWISSAHVWCAIQRPEYINSTILGEPHSQQEFRVNGPLSNHIEFAKDFNCTAGSNMNPDLKCKLW